VLGYAVGIFAAFYLSTNAARDAKAAAVLPWNASASNGDDTCQWYGVECETIGSDRVVSGLNITQVLSGVPTLVLWVTLEPLCG
jgi:hypothetical protein